MIWMLFGLFSAEWLPLFCCMFLHFATSALAGFIGGSTTFWDGISQTIIHRNGLTAVLSTQNASIAGKTSCRIVKEIGFDGWRC